MTVAKRQRRHRSSPPVPATLDARAFATPILPRRPPFVCANVTLGRQRRLSSGASPGWDTCSLGSPEGTTWTIRRRATPFPDAGFENTRLGKSDCDSSQRAPAGRSLRLREALEWARERELHRQVSGIRRERWTFTLRACRTDFHGYASLPCAGRTVTSVRGSLGSCQASRDLGSPLRYNGLRYNGLEVCLRKLWRGPDRLGRVAGARMQTRESILHRSRRSAAAPRWSRACKQRLQKRGSQKRGLQAPFAEVARERHPGDDSTSPRCEALGAR